MIIPQLTAFDPDACGDLIQGIDFHRNKFDKGINSQVQVYYSIYPITTCFGFVQAFHETLLLDVFFY